MREGGGDRGGEGGGRRRGRGKEGGRGGTSKSPLKLSGSAFRNSGSRAVSRLQNNSEIHEVFARLIELAAAVDAWPFVT